MAGAIPFRHGPASRHPSVTISTILQMGGIAVIAACIGFSLGSIYMNPYDGKQVMTRNCNDGEDTCSGCCVQRQLQSSRRCPLHPC